MKTDPLVLAVTSDFAGKIRGKAFSASEFEKRLKRGIGWTPTNVQITCFDIIADSPYGALGDLVLRPDANTRTDIFVDRDSNAESFVIGNIFHTDGQPWECCTRSILKAALDRLESCAGLHIRGAFEHEFHIKNLSLQAGFAYTSAGFRAMRPFSEMLFSALQQAGVKTDTFMKEYGANQYEITVAPSDGIQVADQAVLVRELTYLVGEKLGLEPSFTPIRDVASVGNGVHVHLSLWDNKGQPASYHPDNPYNLSEQAGRFIAGVLKYLDSILALTAPSVISYFRLTPHRWSAAYNNLGFRDREASVRVCPVSDKSDIKIAEQFNFEYRAADAAASPYLVLAAIIHAGCQGIEDQLPSPMATEEDLSLLSQKELSARGYIRLPQSLPAALESFVSNATVTSWFPGAFADIYHKHKLGEIAATEGKDEAELCAAYEAVY